MNQKVFRKHRKSLIAINNHFIPNIGPPKKPLNYVINK